MDIKSFFSAKRALFFILFVILVLIGKNINFSPLVGAENQFFTLFQFFGTTAGALLGPIVGIITVAFSQIADHFIIGKEWSFINILRFLPMIFAAYYFGTKKKSMSIIIPLLCITAFLLHPLGRTVWFFPLFWLIPILGILLPDHAPGKLLFRSLGATFTAHAVGGAIWVWTIPMTAGQWISLIPVVAYERIIFALGIAGSYLLFNTVLDYVVEKWKIAVPNVLFMEKKYSLIVFLKKYLS